MRNHHIQTNSDGILLFIRLTPNARKDEVLGVAQGANGPLITAKVRAIPDKGKANTALVALISKWLGVTKSDITLKSGSKSRCKTLFISGNNADLAMLVSKALEQTDG